MLFMNDPLFHYYSFPSLRWLSVKSGSLDRKVKYFTNWCQLHSICIVLVCQWVSLSESLSFSVSDFFLSIRLSDFYRAVLWADNHFVDAHNAYCLWTLIKPFSVLLHIFIALTCFSIRFLVAQPAVLVWQCILYLAICVHGFFFSKFQSFLWSHWKRLISKNFQLCWVQ